MNHVFTIDRDADKLTATRRPDARHIARVSIADLPASCSQKLYTNPAYLAALGIDEVVLVRPACINAASEATPPAVFADRGRHMLHLGRLSHCDGAAVSNVAEALFRETNAKFVIFEDIEIARGEGNIDRPAARFDYQANWRIDLVPGDLPISSSQRRQIRSKARRLVEATGKETRLEFSRSDEQSIDRIVAFNRAKIREGGRRHHLSEQKLSALKAVCADVGYQALLYCGDEIIAGDIICVSGSNAYTMVLGYDLAYEHFSPGMQVHVFAVARLQDLGCTQVNFLWGDSPWKARMGATRLQLTTIAVTRNRRTLLAPQFLRECVPYAVATAKNAVRTQILRRKG